MNKAVGLYLLACCLTFSGALRAGSLFVTSAYCAETCTGSLTQFNALNGTYIGQATGVFGAGVAIGPNGNAFVSNGSGASVLEYSGSTDALLSTFVSSGSGGLSWSDALTFGPNGNLYVTNWSSSSGVLEYNGATGAFIGTFVGSGSGALGYSEGLNFGPSGNLYVTDTLNNRVLEYNGTTGAFLQTFVTAGSGGLNEPSGLVFGPDGNLYVNSNASNQVLEYNGTTGAFVRDFVAAGSGGLSDPRGLKFGPDGNLYVANDGTARVLEYNGTTGASMGVFASTNLVFSANDLAFTSGTPEPGTWLLGGCGLVVLIAARRNLTPRPRLPPRHLRILSPRGATSLPCCQRLRVQRCRLRGSPWFDPRRMFWSRWRRK